MYLTKPNVWELGSRPRILVVPTDQDDMFFEPSEMRLSVKAPSGTITTVSGAELTIASGYYFYYYKPETRGWYEYESWVKDSAGREITKSNGFEIIDRVY